MIKQKHDHFVDDKNGREYARIRGGLAWPVARKPGQLVIIGENLTVRHGKKPKYYILAEQKDFNVSKLLRSAIALGRKYCVDIWIGDTGNSPMFDYMQRLKIYLTMTSPPYIDEQAALGAYVSQIRELADASNKRLYFGGSRLSAALQDIALTDVRNTTRVTDFPEITALGGLLVSLESAPHDPREMARVAHITDSILSGLYDDFDGGE
jgi:hypothetical protein